MIGNGELTFRNSKFRQFLFFAHPAEPMLRIELTRPDSLREFQDVIWINSHSGQRQYPI